MEREKERAREINRERERERDKERERERDRWRERERRRERERGRGRGSDLCHTGARLGILVGGARLHLSASGLIFQGLYLCVNGSICLPGAPSVRPPTCLPGAPFVSLSVKGSISLRYYSRGSYQDFECMATLMRLHNIVGNFSFF